MKILVLMSVNLISTLALAFPSLNDSAVYEGIQTVNGVNNDVKVTVKLIDQDTAKASYLQHMEIVIGENHQVKEQWLTADQMMTSDSVNNILTNCEAARGTPEVVTVENKSYNTCHLQMQDAETSTELYVADVVFGIAKLVETRKADGSVIGFTIRSYTTGQ